MPYLTLKLFHVLAVVLFLGNITTGLFWKLHAERSGEPRIIAHAFEGISRSDRWFTIPGVVVIIATGIGAAIIGGYPLLRTGWIFWSLVLITLSGLAFMYKVAPLQRQIADLARDGDRTGSFDWQTYRNLTHVWDLWGAVALLAPAAAAVLMVFKPALPAL